MKNFVVFCLVFLSTIRATAQSGSGFVGATDCYPKTFSIQVYITEDKNGNLNTSTAEIQTAVNQMNTYFSDICVQFQVCDFQVIPNTDHDTILMGTDDLELTSMYHRNNTINLYVVQSVMGGNCGETTRGDTIQPAPSNNRDAIFINKPCVGDEQSMARLFGKYFGLFPTYYIGNELVDGSNCQTAGDRLCDTPADLQLIGFNSTDANGDFYSPDWGNLMRFTSVGDEYHFTAQQLNVMLQVMQTGRNYLW